MIVSKDHNKIIK